VQGRESVHVVARTVRSLHRTYVGAIERAEENLTLRTLDKLAKALGVKPAELLQSSQRRPV
jgi:transcriptional regulator with XRE-family HTH domain